MEYCQIISVFTYIDGSLLPQAVVGNQVFHLHKLDRTLVRGQTIQYCTLLGDQGILGDTLVRGQTVYWSEKILHTEAIFTNSSRTLFAKCSQTYGYLLPYTLLYICTVHELCSRTLLNIASGYRLGPKLGIRSSEAMKR